MKRTVCFISEAATKKLLGEFKKEAESILELNFWKDIENMRGDYHYPEEEGVPYEEIGLCWKKTVDSGYIMYV